jgi:Ran GTPase-activating protein (RanGAP) involved in mRNA processing and transport
MYEALAHSLRFNPIVQSLDLSNCQLNKFAIRTLVDALVDNHCLHSLNLSHNPLEDISARVLWSSLSRNQTLKQVALADCKLSAPSIAGALGFSDLISQSLYF